MTSGPQPVHPLREAARKPMRTSDISFLALLASLALLIWLRDPVWQSRWQDTFPILAGIPLFIWFRRPWHFTDKTSADLISFRNLACPVALYLAGVLADLTLLLALAWTLLLRSWIIARTDVDGAEARITKLLALPFLSFPWVATDLSSLGWAFRLSGAAAVGQLFSAFQYDVVRQGTCLWVQGKSMSIEAACSGLNGLQSILIAGTTLAYLKLKDSPLFWWNLPVLVAAAWLANTLRIVFLAVVAVEGGQNIQNEIIHGLAGWVSLCLAFGLCWFLFSLQERKTRNSWRELAQQPNG